MHFWFLTIQKLTAAFQWQRSEELIKNASPNGHEMLLDGKAPLTGQLFTNKTLGKTFRTLGEQGKDGFYKGRVAEEIVKLIQSQGGVMELEDLANHTSTFVEPIKYTYAGEVTVYECPPNGQGLTALMALGILEQMQEQGKIRDPLAMEHNSPEYLHALVEALRYSHFTCYPMALLNILIQPGVRRHTVLCGGSGGRTCAGAGAIEQSACAALS
jgi:gamma-glutamyltranspeptidase/glutathione hydrolase